MYTVEFKDRTEIIKSFDPQVINAVYTRAKPAIQVYRGDNETFLYDEEGGWVFENLTERELNALRAAFKTSSKSLRLVVS